MKIIFVRHGHPNYDEDCLTELGHRQAELAAERLKDIKIDKFYSSSCGRAYETACHIAEKHGDRVEKLDFMREIHLGSRENNDYVHPWALAEEWVREGKEIMNIKWQCDPAFDGSAILKSCNRVIDNFDKWLEPLGYKREGHYYRVTKTNDNTVLLVSHGGSSSAVLSHIFNLPFTFLCRAVCPGLTAISEISFTGNEGELISPQIELLNDVKHLNM